MTLLSLTLRARLLLVLVATVVGVLLPLWLLLSVRVTRFAEKQLADSVNERLQGVIQPVRKYAEPPPEKLRVLKADLTREARELYGWGFVQSGNGETWFTAGTPRNVRRALVEGVDPERSWNDLSRVVFLPGGAAVGLAADLGKVRELNAALGRTYALGAGALLLLVAAAGWASVNGGLRPLRQIAGRAERLSAADLGARLEVPAARDEVRSLAESLNRMLGHLQTSFAALEAEEARTRQFAADASHELRTPLAALGGYLEVLARAPDDPVVRSDLLVAARREAVRATRLVEDLLTLARLDAGEALQRQTLDVGAFLTRFAASVRLIAPEHEVRAEVEGANLPPICVDLGRLEQALWNLARNAARYGPPGTPIVLRAGVREGEVVLGVEDAGPGLGAEALERGFERFYRAERDERGAGLGLAIVRSIARAHGGEAGLENLPGGGGRAWISVPRGPCRSG